jgi:isoquinoline 1-oxidoreductase beta subunit
MHVARLRAVHGRQRHHHQPAHHVGGRRHHAALDGRNLPALAGPVDMPDKTTAEGLFDKPYGIAHQRMEHVATRMGVPVGFWRSVGIRTTPSF